MRYDPGFVMALMFIESSKSALLNIADNDALFVLNTV